MIPLLIVRDDRLQTGTKRIQGLPTVMVTTFSNFYTFFLFGFDLKETQWTRSTVLP
jgi:hypothetical protein